MYHYKDYKKTIKSITRCLDIRDSTFHNEDYAYFCNIPKELMTYELCFDIVKMYGSIILRVPGEFITVEMWNYAISKYGHLLGNIPKKFKTNNMCVNAIKNNKYAFDYIPKELVFRYSDVDRYIKRIHYRGCPKHINRMPFYIGLFIFRYSVILFIKN